MEQISRVAVIPCPSYEQELVDQAVRDGLACLGGVGQYVNSGEQILLKPNLLKKAEPELAVTTHPAVFAAVAKCVKAAGCDEIFYGDSPGLQPFEEAARVSGIRQAAEALGVMPGDFHEGVFYPWPEGRTAREFILCRGAAEADGIINVCKMKTHALERITGAVKNLYGCVQGKHKSAGHVRYPSAAHFASMLCDLHRALKPRLHIMDGITAMEGNGPGSGTPVHMGVLLFSTDPVALDTVFCRLIHLDPALVPTNFCGQQYGIGTMEEKKIELVTVEREKGETGDCPIVPLTMEEAVSRWGKADFDADRNPRSERAEWKLLRRVMKPFQQRPFIRADLCVRCGICVDSCPVEGKAVSFQKGRLQPPVYDYGKCIRCYCCQEMCPKKAIEVKTPRIARLFR